MVILIQHDLSNYYNLANRGTFPIISTSFVQRIV